jgi:hypothetical protein
MELLLPKLTGLNAVSRSLHHLPSDLDQIPTFTSPGSPTLPSRTLSSI